MAIDRGWTWVTAGGLAAVLWIGMPVARAAEPRSNKPAAAAPAVAAPATADELYDSTRVWPVHLTFTAEQWAAMEPSGPFGPGGQIDFGRMIAGAMAPAFMKSGDIDQDGKLSRAEFERLATAWFDAWDVRKAGVLKSDDTRDGLTAALAAAGIGQAPGGPPRVGLQGPEGKRNGVAGMMGIEFKYVHADLDFAGKAIGDVGVRYKGNGSFLESRAQLKRSLKVDLNHFAKGQKLAGRATLNLHSEVTDPSLMIETLAYRLFRDAGVPAPRTAYARVSLTVPGKHDRAYVGVYTLVENVDRHFAADHFGKHADEGALFKPVSPDLFADMGDTWRMYNQSFDPKTELTDAQKKRVMDTCTFVAHADDATFAAKLGDYFDLDNLARYMAVTVLLTDLDSILGPGQNLYLYLDPKTNRFSFIPWDQDHSFGQFKYSQEQRERLSIDRPWEGEKPFLERLFKVDAFKKAYLARLDEFGRTVFKAERLAGQVDEVAKAIRDAVAAESPQKLAAFDRAVAGQSPVGGSVFTQGSKPVKGFVAARAKSVADQVAGRDKGLTISGPGGFGGFGGPRPGGAPGKPPKDPGPGVFLVGPFSGALDADRDAKLSRAEFTGGFARWFAAWDADKDGVLTDEELRAGIGRDMMPRFGPPPGPPAKSPKGGP